MVRSSPRKKRKVFKAIRKSTRRRGNAQPEAPARGGPPSQPAIAKMEGFLANLFKGLERQELVDLKIPQLRDGVMQEEICITRCFYDGNSSRSYTRTVVIASLVYELLEMDETVTMRGVFYMLSKKKLASTAEEVAKCIRELGNMLSLRTPEMNIVPEPKGWIAGDIRFRFNIRGKLAEGKVWGDWESATQSMLISDEWLVADDEDIEMVVPDEVKFILVIEKLTIFRRLVRNNVINRRECILVCSSGEYD
jgi:DNA topoisomerase VI subunit A